MLVTVSANHVTGDRTLTEAIWEVTGLNAGHALLVLRKFGDGSSLSSRAQLVVLSECDFYDAKGLFEAADGSC
jgi:hypothetical protein